MPVMEPYSRHIIICGGGFCSPDGKGEQLYSLLPALLESEGLLFGPARVKRSIAPCLGVCSEGPIAVVYPDGVWYSRVDEELLQRIVKEHLGRGRVVDEAVFFRLEV
jgi:(2Fe-2S) ferredoxin